ncbi:PolC-type DNA polymerase III [Caldisalinibacter kiritimatiensis]|uniref:DNA polymerase III PolC-type n=1 Tax=Caldisalinibacter kiritimatiensis TaxID=1304284 RepID=R1ATZ7_9FIRM|nr:PolC-type DNA polymerase III [Caldisalinibacter kiritimatiensis]EOD00618.1 DNA polymerase III alpha subunit [Caldisalinibacter kiritimatiensis]
MSLNNEKIFGVLLNKINLEVKDENLYNSIVSKVYINTQNNILKIVLNVENVIEYEKLYEIRLKLKNKLKGFNDIKINVVYKGVELSTNELLRANWENILYLIKQRVPSSTAWIKSLNWELKEDILLIKVSSEIALMSIKKKGIDEEIKRRFNEEYGIDLKVVFEFKKSSNDITNEHLKKKIEEETNYIRKIKVNTSGNNNKSESKSNKGISNKKKVNKNIIYGKKVGDSIIKIAEINTNTTDAIIEGEVFDLDTRELKNEKKLYMFNITDYSNSITVKLFANKKARQSLDENLKEGLYLRVEGNVVFDNFIRELIIIGKGVKVLEKVERADTSEKKRVELHVHTQMSAMDGVSSFSDIAKRAAKWGHKAIAITDHGVVQSFPEGMSAAKKYGIKVLYGVEGYLVNDSKAIVKNFSNQTLDCEYVVFDIETTGFSPVNDRITEIGAVKIKNNQIVDRYNQLINPQIKIPEKIVELTGITDELVKDKPTIEEVITEFLDFVGDSVLVAHNASFDMGFIKEKASRQGIDIKNASLDTLELSRVLFPDLKRHKLNILAKHLNIKLENHHRAVDDAEATAHIFIKMLNILHDERIKKLEKINTAFNKNRSYKSERPYHIVIFAKNYTGLKNLYKIVSESHLKYFYRKPRIPKSLLAKYREGLILGTACEAGELYKAVLRNADFNELRDIINFYDYLEIQPIDNNLHLIEKGIVKDREELKFINKKIASLGEKFNKPVVATGDVHFLDPQDEVYRRILMAGQGFSDADKQAPLYLKTTDEMLEEFSYLGSKKAEEVVIYNTNKIADMIDDILPIPEGTFPPIIEGSEEELRRMTYEKATSIYGDPLPEIVKDRLERELNSIISNGYAVLYIIAHKLVKKSLDDGYLVGSRGSVGSSFVATMSDITEVNPLPPHYVCPNCKNSEFIIDGSVGSGVDMEDKKCPKCGTQYIKDGHDIPFEVFLGFEGDKEPDIDLNFAGEYQSVAHKYTEELFGEGYVYRAGTIGTIAEKTAYGFVKKYFEERGRSFNSAEVNRLVKGCTGVKRTSGQHPGGVMVVPRNKEIYDFTPIQYPANDASSGVITTHFDYHSISGRILKLDILGHDTPSIIRMLEDLTGVNAQEISLDDEETMKIFTSTESLGITKEDINSETGTFGIPEFGTNFVRQMLIDTKPTTFAELVRISGLSHGTDVWLNNAQDLVRNGVAQLSEVISTRDDIMTYLIYNGLDKKKSFIIMEKVRKGKGLTEEEETYMRENNIPEWYIESCKKIKYMFPKAHAVAYVMMSFRIAYFKVHYPIAFYATYFTTKANDFDADLIVNGKEAVKKEIESLNEKGNDKTAKEKNSLIVLEVALEMYARGFKFEKVDLYKSDSDRFLIGNEGIIPPLKSLQGVGENAARRICKEREKGKFISVEDLVNRTKVSKTVIEALRNHGCLDGMSESNQLSLFNI